jgi:hypothetical protein
MRPVERQGHWLKGRLLVLQREQEGHSLADRRQAGMLPAVLVLAGGSNMAEPDFAHILAHARASMTGNSIMTEKSPPTCILYNLSSFS